MPMQQVEYEFPDPDKEEALQEVEIPEQEPETPKIEVEGAVGRETIEKPSKKAEEGVIQAGEVEIEVENDVPPEDRNRSKAPPPEDVTDEELAQYTSEKVKQRIKHFSKGYHDERRAKETAMRERQALETYAKQLVEENKKLKGSVDEGHNALIESAKKQVTGELDLAKQQYKEAFETGQPDEILEAQTKLNAAQIRMERVDSLKAKPVPEKETPLQTDTNQVQQQQVAPTVQAAHDPLAERDRAWAEKNKWFGTDDEMTAFALGANKKLEREGILPHHDEYYERVDARMRAVFPEHFKDDGIDELEETPKKPSSNVVAPATRSTSPNKIRLKQSEIAVAKRLGVPLEYYAAQVAKLAREQNV